MAIIVGCDFHSRFQSVAYMDTETAEVIEKRLTHPAEAEAFYRSLPPGAVVGVETSSCFAWFGRLLEACGHRLRVGHAARIAAYRTRRQKHDRGDAELILDLLIQDRFPEVWQPSAEMRDRRALLLHRHRLVQHRTRLVNQLRAVGRGEGVVGCRSLRSRAGRRALEALPLAPWAAERRRSLLEFHDQLQSQIERLDTAVEQLCRQDPVCQLLRTHPGVGPVTAVFFPLAIGSPQRFHTSREVVSYLGLNPREDSSGGKQRLGRISKQGNAMARFLLVEAAQTARADQELGRFYHRLAHRRGRSMAKVAVARKLAIRLWLMWLRGIDYQQWLANRSARGEAREMRGPTKADT